DTSAQTLTGISEADATINVYDGSAFLGTVTADDTGAWSYGLGVLADGSHSLTATATDAAGNTSAASDATAFTVDTVPPSPILVSVATSGSGLTLAGTSEAGSTVNVYDGATLVGSAVATADGTWSLSASQLSSSVHDFSLQATDLAGNTGTYSGENLVDGGKNGSLVGGSGDDFLWGGPGNGNLSGGAGDDRLDGGSGNDLLNGGTGNDRLVGGTGNDTLTGGSGSDVFVFDRGFGHDVVTDFTPGTDHLELSRDLFGAGWTDAQIYSYIVDHALRHGHDLILNIDGSDNITLSNISLTSLHSSDFIFT
ncbi:MAG TPA: Ig-like domain-containing protein, partial [Sphingomicrobium sp.]|nr:Ig-like domain-containing protein [Sphingomicrobium sp.]